MAETLAMPAITKTRPKHGEWTYADYLDLPDNDKRYEIIEGILYVTNAQNIDHQSAVMEIAYKIKQFAEKENLGRVLTAPFEVHLTETTHPVQPDVLFIRTENWPGSGAKYFDGAPDIVVEVLWPSTSRTDRVVKFTAYEHAGVPEYWIVNPKSKAVEVFTLSGQEYGQVGEFIGDEMIESKVLAGLKNVTSSIF